MSEVLFSDPRIVMVVGAIIAISYIGFAVYQIIGTFQIERQCELLMDEADRLRNEVES